MKRFSLSKVFAKAESAVAEKVINRSAFRRQRGASAIEYVIIAAVIGVALFVGIDNIDFNAVFSTIKGCIGGNSSVCS